MFFTEGGVLVPRTLEKIARLIIRDVDAATKLEAHFARMWDASESMIEFGPSPLLTWELALRVAELSVRPQSRLPCQSSGGQERFSAQPREDDAFQIILN